jgi:predicted nucleic acid-binding protein
VIYVDSSVLVELYLGGARAGDARAILDEPEAKVASWLLMVEVPVVLRRALPAPADRDVLAACLDRFDTDLDDIGLVDSLTDVGLRVRSDPRFAACRALDAIHACTALLLREWTGRAVRLETFDRRLQALAGDLRLS